MTPTPPFKLNKTFGETKVALKTVTDSPVIVAIAANKPFPDHHEGEISALRFSTDTGESLSFGDGGKVKFSLKAEARQQLGLYTGPQIIKLLDLDDAKQIGLDFGAARHSVFLMGYALEGKIDGSHPIGALGSAKFGVTARRERSLAVVYRFEESTGAQDVLAETFRSWQPLSTVTQPDDLAEGALLITELEGSLGIKLSAALGYDLSFVREVEGLGLTGDIGLKIDLGLKATLGFDVAGRYLAALERTNAKTLRLRLFKLRHQGWNFGLNLSARAETVTPLPDSGADDFIKAVFGVHGEQIVRDLQLIDQWTDPKKPWAVQLAGLARETGMDLLRDVTGMSSNEPSTFRNARDQVKSALDLWQNLPSRVSGWLWTALERGGLAGNKRVVFENTLRLLAAPAEATRQKELTRILGLTGVDDQHGLQFIVSFADHGLSPLLKDSHDLRAAASRVLQVLDGGVIEKLQKFILEKLNLDQILKFGQPGGGNKIDQWLANRLTNFLGKKFDPEKLEQVEQIRTAIHKLMAKRKEIYDKARLAVERQYDFHFGFTYQSATEKTALIDASFDMTKPAAQALLATLTGGHGDYGSLLTTRTPGVTLHEGVLTHGLRRSTTVEVSLPFFKSKETTITESLATVTAEEEGGRVLCYNLDAKDAVQSNRLRSQVALTGALALQPSTGLRIHDRDCLQWTYRLDQILLGARRADLVQRAQPLIDAYFPGHFRAGADSSFDAYLSGLDDTIEAILGNGKDTFGDVLVSFDVALPGQTVAAWFARRDEAATHAAARRVSLQIQRSLQRIIPFFYFEDLNNLALDPAGTALFVFASLPPRNALTGKGPIWNVARPEEVDAMLALPETALNLGTHLSNAQRRLSTAGRAAQAERLAARSVNVRGNPQFAHLLNVMSSTVGGATKALKEMREFHESNANDPERAVEALSKFGAALTSTFHSELKSVYGTRVLRQLGSVIFLEAARALDPHLPDIAPQAVLCGTVLKTRRSFVPADFLQNKRPATDDIALEQRLVQA